MTQLTAENLEWLWDYEKQKPHIRHWPAITTGLVHIRDVSDLTELRQAAANVSDADEWADAYIQAMPASQFSVALDTLADVIDHNRKNCLGEAANLKGFSESIFALVRGEVLTSLPFPARLALLADGLATIETRDHGHNTREALEELTVSDLQTLAKQSDGIPQKLRKGELIDALAAAEDSGEIELPLGDIVPAPPLHNWIENLVSRYVSALHDALADPVYPDVYREAVWHEAINQASIDPLKRALELEYWDVLEHDIEETEVDPDDESDDDTMRAEPRQQTVAGDWRPGISHSDRDKAVMWLAVGLLFVGWLFF